MKGITQLLAVLGTLCVPTAALANSYYFSEQIFVGAASGSLTLRERTTTFAGAFVLGVEHRRWSVEAGFGFRSFLDHDTPSEQTGFLAGSLGVRHVAPLTRFSNKRAWGQVGAVLRGTVSRLWRSRTQHTGWAMAAAAGVELRFGRRTRSGFASFELGLQHDWMTSVERGIKRRSGSANSGYFALTVGF